MKVSVNDDRGRTLPWRWRHLVSAAQASAISYGKNRRRVVTDNTVFRERGESRGWSTGHLARQPLSYCEVSKAARGTRL